LAQLRNGLGVASPRMTQNTRTSCPDLWTHLNARQFRADRTEDAIGDADMIVQLVDHSRRRAISKTQLRRNVIYDVGAALRSTVGARVWSPLAVSAGLWPDEARTGTWAIGSPVQPLVHVAVAICLITIRCRSADRCKVPGQPGFFCSCCPVNLEKTRCQQFLGIIPNLCLLNVELHSIAA